MLLVVIDQYGSDGLKELLEMDHATFEVLLTALDETRLVLGFRLVCKIDAEGEVKLTTSGCDRVQKELQKKSRGACTSR